MRDVLTTILIFSCAVPTDLDSAIEPSEKEDRYAINAEGDLIRDWYHDPPNANGLGTSVCFHVYDRGNKLQDERDACIEEQLQDDALGYKLVFYRTALDKDDVLPPFVAEAKKRIAGTSYHRSACLSYNDGSGHRIQENGYRYEGFDVYPPCTAGEHPSNANPIPNTELYDVIDFEASFTAIEEFKAGFAVLGDESTPLSQEEKDAYVLSWLKNAEQETNQKFDFCRDRQVPWDPFECNSDCWVKTFTKKLGQETRVLSICIKTYGTLEGVGTPPGWEVPPDW